MRIKRIVINCDSYEAADWAIAFLRGRAMYKLTEDVAECVHNAHTSYEGTGWTISGRMVSLEVEWAPMQAPKGTLEVDFGQRGSERWAYEILHDVQELGLRAEAEYVEETASAPHFSEWEAVLGDRT